MSEETARPPRRRAAVRRLLAVIVVAALTVGLFWGYLLQSRTQSANADAAGQVLQGWDMLHGNWLLRGWTVSDVSFYTFEVPLDGLISLIYGLRVDVVHVAAAVEYALLVLLTGLLAAGTARDRRRGGREAWVRGLLAAAIMVAPGFSPGAHVLLLAPDHTGVGVPALAALLAADRIRPRRWPWATAAALLAGLLLIWAELDDPVAEFGAALPLALACATALAAVPFRRAARWVRRRRGGPATPAAGWRRGLARHCYDLALAAAAVASYFLTRAFVQAIGHAGGFYIYGIRGPAQLSDWAAIGRQAQALGQNLLILFGANFWGKQQPLTAYGYLHLAGVAVAALGLLIAIGRWPWADRVTRTLTLAVLIVLAAGAVSPLMEPISGTHEVAIVAPLSAALAGRCLGPWLAGRRPAGTSGPVTTSLPASADGVASADCVASTDGVASADEAGEAGEPDQPAESRPRRLARLGTALRAAAASVLIAAGIGYLASLGYSASRPSRPAADTDLAQWLGAHSLTSGIGGYWDANITTLDSGGAVRVAPVTDGASYGYLWESRPRWFDPDVSSATFVIAHSQRLGAGYVYAKDAIDWYGTPALIYSFGTTEILLYDYNLLSTVIQPVRGELNAPG